MGHERWQMEKRITFCDKAGSCSMVHGLVRVDSMLTPGGVGEDIEGRGADRQALVRPEGRPSGILVARYVDSDLVGGASDGKYGLAAKLAQDIYSPADKTPVGHKEIVAGIRKAYQRLGLAPDTRVVRPWRSRSPQRRRRV